MAEFRFIKPRHAFVKCNAGSVSVQSALLIGAGIIVVALIAAPLLESASRSYASNNTFGVDPLTTASTSKTKRYTIRRSVLQTGEVLYCPEKIGGVC